MQVVAHPLNERLPNLIGLVRSFQGLVDGSYVSHYQFLLVALVQIGHLACVKQVVDVFQEGLIKDLRIREKESNGFADDPCILEQFLQKLSKTLMIEAFDDLDGAEAVAHHKGSQSGETLLAASAHTDQHDASTQLSQHTRDS